MSDGKRELSRAILPAVMLVVCLVGLAVLSFALPKGRPLNAYKLLRNGAVLGAWPLFGWWALVRVYGSLSNVPANERRGFYIGVVLVLVMMCFFIGAYITLRVGATTP
jgi:hypothetical protein